MLSRFGSRVWCVKAPLRNCPPTLNFWLRSSSKLRLRVTIVARRTHGDIAGAKDSESKPQPDEKLVRVFDAEQESEAMVVQGLLESQGIETNVTSLDAQQDILPGVGGTVIEVREEDAAKARLIIEEYRETPSEIEIEDQEDAADAATGDPARES